ncbi:MAG: spondin domain-containing protein [Acidobacteriota bacterium]
MPARRFVILAVLGCLVCLTPAFGQTTGAECTLTFDAVWSAATHPMAFPPDPHFSGLIGGTHDELTVFWRGGDLATPGIQQVAETGSKSQFRQEVEDAILAGFAGEVISGGGIGQSPGSRSVSFNVEPGFPFVTVVTMIAPSPDWFVGVHGLSLFENGQWVQQKVVQLPAYDAGTDSGASYTSPDVPTIPPVPIFEITQAPFPGGTSLGTFTFVCDSSLVFGDNFEDGTFGAWSSSVP